ncbi:hypothetical protein [Sphingomonas sp.]|uniref:hypothetical protein n=1 Tax=Sphingomonas sp. TaxID=28214 RepID=UPI00286E40CE|nr:hypothetical protein [Sphingomonas sp.]
MTKTASVFAAIGLAAGLAALPAPATAQADNVNEIIVYGSDPCPRSTDDEVVVCARKPESERYRIPERLRTGGARQTREAWANKAKSFETVGASGINSCSAVGPGGHTGCLKNIIDQARAESRESEVENTAPEQ